MFLSGYDLFIQRSFFSDPRMTALVIDPLAGDAGWFGWAGDDIVELGSAATRRAPAATAASGHVTGAPSPRRRVARTVAAMAVVGLLSATAGYAAASLLSPLDEQLSQATATVAGQQAQIAELQAAQGATEPPSEPAPSQDTDAIIVVAQPGDSWWSLAERFYDDGFRHPEISRANPTVTGLEPGQRVVVPGAQPAE